VKNLETTFGLVEAITRRELNESIMKAQQDTDAKYGHVLEAVPQGTCCMVCMPVLSLETGAILQAFGAMQLPQC
jgi:hypothetical protein